MIVKLFRFKPIDGVLGGSWSFIKLIDELDIDDTEVSRYTHVQGFSYAWYDVQGNLYAVKQI